MRFASTSASVRPARSLRLERRTHGPVTRSNTCKWRLESRKNAKAVLASLGLALVEGVRMGDAPLRSAHSFNGPAFGVL